jgi:hypothetical protein
MPEAQTALSYQAEVDSQGKIELAVPLPAGTRVLVFVLEEPEDCFAGLLDASRSSQQFWDHPWDDEDWNHP